MTCAVANLRTDIVGYAQELIERCEASGEVTLPTNLDDFCGDGAGLIAEIYTAVSGGVTAGLFYSGGSPDPGAPPTCYLNETYLTAFRDWLRDLSCADEYCEATVDFYATSQLGRPYAYAVFDNGNVFEVGDYNVSWISGIMTETIAGPLSPGWFPQSFRHNNIQLYGLELGKEFYCGTFVVRVRVTPHCNAGATSTPSVHDVYRSRRPGNYSPNIAEGQADMAGDNENITLTVPSIIGIEVTYIADGQRAPVWRFYGESTYRLVRCPNPCYPLPVTSLSAERQDNGDWAIGWNLDGTCYDGHEVYVHRTSTEDDCQNAGCDTFQPTVDDLVGTAACGATSYTVPNADMPIGTYCIQVISYKMQNIGGVSTKLTARSENICVYSECTIPAPTAIWNSPPTSLATSSTTAYIGYNAYVTNASTFRLYRDGGLINSGTAPQESGLIALGGESLPLGTYFLRLEVTNGCGNTVIAERTFIIYYSSGGGNNCSLCSMGGWLSANIYSTSSRTYASSYCGGRSIRITTTYPGTTSGTVGVFADGVGLGSITNAGTRTFYIPIGTASTQVYWQVDGGASGGTATISGTC